MNAARWIILGLTAFTVVASALSVFYAWQSAKARRRAEAAYARLAAMRYPAPPARPGYQEEWKP